jgi:hypothetical protein
MLFLVCFIQQQFNLSNIYVNVINIVRGVKNKVKFSYQVLVSQGLSKFFVQLSSHQMML